MSKSTATANAQLASTGRRVVGIAPLGRRGARVVLWSASLIVISIAAGSAWAQPAPSFDGRWRDAASNVVLDISPCTAGWCGIAVDKENCDGQKLELSVPAAVNVVAVGVYDLAGAGRRYPVQASWRGDKLIIADNAQGNLAIARRSVSPIILTLTRIGAAVCGAKPAS